MSNKHSKKKWCPSCQEATNHSKKNKCKECGNNTIPKPHFIEEELLVLEEQDFISRYSSVDDLL